MRDLQKRAAKDDSLAMYKLALEHFQGSCVPRQGDIAFDFLLQAANLGSVDAISCLGRACAFGEDVVQDSIKGRKYLEVATKMGCVIARCNLGAVWAYKHGDYGMAIRHWRLAAEAGYDGAIKKLWMCYHKGKLSKSILEEMLRKHHHVKI